jgi:hypothetical protein
MERCGRPPGAPCVHGPSPCGMSGHHRAVANRSRANRYGLGAPPNGHRDEPATTRRSARPCGRQVNGGVQAGISAQLGRLAHQTT